MNRADIRESESRLLFEFEARLIDLSQKLLAPKAYRAECEALYRDYLARLKDIRKQFDKQK